MNIRMRTEARHLPPKELDMKASLFPELSDLGMDIALVEGLGLLSSGMRRVISELQRTRGMRLGKVCQRLTFD